jgi:hypothetical protein
LVARIIILFPGSEQWDGEIQKLSIELQEKLEKGSGGPDGARNLSMPVTRLNEVNNWEP